MNRGEKTDLHPDSKLRLKIALLVMVTATLLLMPVPFKSELARELCNLVHLPLFMILTLSTLAWRESHFIPQKQPYTWIVPLFWFSVGTLLEIMQRFVQRGSSWEDAVANAQGVGIGWIVFQARYRASGPWRPLWTCLALILFIVAWGQSWLNIKTAILQLP